MLPPVEPGSLLLPATRRYWEMRFRLKRGLRLSHGGERYPQCPWSPHRALGPGDAGRILEPEFRDALEPLLDCHAQFHAREIGTDATVDAQPEGRMPVFLPVEQHLVRVGKHFRIAVCRRKRK